MRPVRILVTAAEKVPSVELGALIPLRAAEARGICELLYKALMQISILDLAWCDILFIVRGVTVEAVDCASAAKKYGRVILGYWDDDMTGIPAYSSSFKQRIRPDVQQSIKELFSITDKFFTPTAKLAQKLSQLHGREAGVLPVLPLDDRFKQPTRDMTGKRTAGYAGSADHGKLLNSLCLPAMSGLHNKFMDVEFEVLGPPPAVKYWTKGYIKYIPYIRNYQKYLDLAVSLDWHIGMAMQEADEFTTYKFYNKFMEYSYIGCAGIYSDLEPYKNVIVDGITGLLCENTVKAWEEAAARLLTDGDLAWRIKKNSYDFFRANHDREKLLDKYLSVLGPYLDFRAPEISEESLKGDPQYGRRNKAVRIFHYMRKQSIGRTILDILNHLVAQPAVYAIYLRSLPLFDFISRRNTDNKMQDSPQEADV